MPRTSASRDVAALGAAAVLEIAVAAVGRAVKDGSRTIPGSDALEELDRVADCVSAVLNEEDFDARLERLTSVGLATRLAGAIQAEILDAPWNPGDAGTVLQVLRAVETVRRRVSRQDDSDLAGWLLQPDAFELLVEVAHDLRSPLTSVLFLSETLRGGLSGPLNDVQRSQLGLIYSAALGMVSVTSDMVELAKGERGLLEGAPEPYSVAEVIQGVEGMVRPMAEEKGVELRLKVPEYERAFGHPLALGRVLLNLTTNALKFTDEGYVEVGVQKAAGRRLRYYVRDTGRGIPPERMDDLYQPFKRREGGQGHFFSGSGVGLSICRRLVRAMGSDLELTTEAGWGTMFSFTVSTEPPT